MSFRFYILWCFVCTLLVFTYATYAKLEYVRIRTYSSRNRLRTLRKLELRLAWLKLLFKVTWRLNNGTVHAHQCLQGSLIVNQSQIQLINYIRDKYSFKSLIKMTVIHSELFQNIHTSAFSLSESENKFSLALTWKCSRSHSLTLVFTCRSNWITFIKQQN